MQYPAHERLQNYSGFEDSYTVGYLKKSNALNGLRKFEVLNMAYKTLHCLVPIPLKDYGALAVNNVGGSKAQAVSFSL